LGFFLQLFNLVPVSPLDGGRMIAAVSRRLWWLGLPLLLAFALFLHSAMALLIFVLVLGQFLRQLRHSPPPGYYDVPAGLRVLALASWLALVVACGAGMVATQLGAA
jgi:Zn-dependent protease